VSQETINDDNFGLTVTVNP